MDGGAVLGQVEEGGVGYVLAIGQSDGFEERASNGYFDQSLVRHLVAFIQREELQLMALGDVFQPFVRNILARTEIQFSQRSGKFAGNIKEGFVGNLVAIE